MNFMQCWLMLVLCKKSILEQIALDFWPLCLSHCVAHIATINYKWCKIETSAFSKQKLFSVFTKKSILLRRCKGMDGTATRRCICCSCMRIDWEKNICCPSQEMFLRRQNHTCQVPDTKNIAVDTFCSDSLFESTFAKIHVFSLPLYLRLQK